MRLSTQSLAWATAYAGFAILTVACAAGAMRGAAPPGRVLIRVLTDEQKEARLTWSRRSRWLTLAFVPSSLLLGVTTFLSTDMAVPLLWMIPLALYLLTFVLAFASRGFVRANVAGGPAVMLMIALVLAIVIDLKEPVWLLIPLHLAGFFVCALALHGQLAGDRPGTGHLTEFYLWIAVGGLAGGTFNTLLAPFLFSSVAEYPLVLVLAVALIAPRRRSAKQRITAADFALPLALGAAVTGLLLGLKGGMLGTVTVSAAAGLIGVLFAACVKHPLRLASGLALVVLGVSSLIHRGDLLHAERTFFGVLRVTADAAEGRHRLFHGSTLHSQPTCDGTIWRP